MGTLTNQEREMLLGLITDKGRAKVDNIEITRESFDMWQITGINTVSATNVRKETIFFKVSDVCKFSELLNKETRLRIIATTSRPLIFG